MLARVHAACLLGIHARAVQVEAHLGKGLPGFELVGLPEAAVRESQVRIKAAIALCDRELPPRSIVVNLAPADLKKSGSAFDLPIAVAVLTASCLIGDQRSRVDAEPRREGRSNQASATQPQQDSLAALLKKTLFVGELSLDGRLRSTRGLLAFLRMAEAQGLTQAVVPASAAHLADLGLNIRLFCAHHLSEVLAFIDGRASLSNTPSASTEVSGTRFEIADESTPNMAVGSSVAMLDMSDVIGQAASKRALEIAAAGGHNVLLSGPPGSGKSMLAQRFASLLPPPNKQEALDIATIASAAGLDTPGLLSGRSLSGVMRPFRAPHYSVSDAALLGGGTPVQPGEVTLAHAGVLFLDELPEYRRSALEGLRTIMELGTVTIARVAQRVTMPARVQVLAAMNPCPCGYRGDTRRACRCAPTQIAIYQKRISGPILDRFDLQVTVSSVQLQELSVARGSHAPNVERSQSMTTRHDTTETTAVIRERVLRARAMRHDRAHTVNTRNLIDCSRLDDTTQSHHDPSISNAVERAALVMLEHAYQRMGLSTRAYFKILNVARTIADLELSSSVTANHVAEAIHYRVFDAQPM